MLARGEETVTATPSCDMSVEAKLELRTMATRLAALIPVLMMVMVAVNTFADSSATTRVLEFTSGSATSSTLRTDSVRIVVDVAVVTRRPDPR